MSKKIKIILISRWPNIKNAEYELIEKIKKVSSKSFEITITDYLGYEFKSKKIINNNKLYKNYDFAISFHYDTPKALNIPTYLFVANPLAFMHSREDYFTRIIPRIISYDGYLYNGSKKLKSHNEGLLGFESTNQDLNFFSSCALAQIKQPSKSRKKENLEKTLFYCGVNWEVLTDNTGRMNDLLKKLDHQNLLHIYGPKIMNNQSPWRGFKNYFGEIPFDGNSIIDQMSEYTAALAISSPAHISSETSSSRVFEAIAAGIPVISDENKYISELFGDSIFYIEGNSINEKFDSIKKTVKTIQNNKFEALKRVKVAQKILREKYIFEHSLLNVHQNLKIKNSKIKNRSKISFCSFDVFIINHNPLNISLNFEKNIEYIFESIINSVSSLGLTFNIFFVKFDQKIDKIKFLNSNIKIKYISLPDISFDIWDSMKMGEKVQSIKKFIKKDFFCLFTQADLPDHDHFIKFIEKLKEMRQKNNFFYISGHKNNLNSYDFNEANYSCKNTFNNFYSFSQDSLKEFPLGAFIFPKKFSKIFDNKPLISNLSSTLPISLLLLANVNNFNIFMSKYITISIAFNYYIESQKNTIKARNKGFWFSQYYSYSDINNELNALYDINNSAEELALLEKIKESKFDSYKSDLIYKAINKIVPIYKFFIRFKRIFARNSS